MNDADYITRPALARELGVKGSYIKTRSERLRLTGVALSLRNHPIGYTPEQADVIRASIRADWAKSSADDSSTPEHVILSLVGAYYGVRIGTLLSGSREPNVVCARMVAAGVLEAQGYSLMAIGRILNRDHSTIEHALAQGVGRTTFAGRAVRDHGRQADVQADVRKLVGQLLMLPTYVPRHLRATQSLERLLGVAIGEHPAARAVSAYVRAVVAGGRRQSPTVLYWGLVSISRDTWLRGRILQLVARLGRPELSYVMASHAEQLGLGWEDARQ